MATWLAALTVLLLGLFVGGFLTTVFERVPDKVPLLTPGPSCDSCRRPLLPRDRIPVASWLILRGKCRWCGEPIDPVYPIVEAATGALFLVTYLWLGMSWALPAYLYLAAVTVAASAIDLRHQRLPDAIVLPSYGIVAALLVIALLGPGGLPDLVRAILAGLASFLFYFVVALINPAGMGGGDVKLSGVLGMLLGWVGWAAVVVGLLASFIIGAVVSIVLMLAGRVGRKAHIPFGPFMFAGTYVGLLYGAAIADWYLR